MKNCINRRVGRILFASALLLVWVCAAVPEKKYFTLNYVPDPMKNKRMAEPYPFTVRIRDFDVEEAYARPQIVYRKSPYEMSYYNYRVWAIKPNAMFTDLVQRHLVSVGMVAHVVRRLDEGFKPQYELTGTIESLQEYDNEDAWFANLAFRVKLVRLYDQKTIWSDRFDGRKKVYQKSPEMVVQELSNLMDVLMNRMMENMDTALYSEITRPGSPD